MSVQTNDFGSNMTFFLGIRDTDEKLRPMHNRQRHNSRSRHRRSDHHRPANITAAPVAASAHCNAATPPHNCHKRRHRRNCGLSGGYGDNCRDVEAVKLRREGSSVYRHTTQQKFTHKRGEIHIYIFVCKPNGYANVLVIAA